MTELPVSDPIAWGTTILEENGYVYVYGAEGNGDGAKRLHMPARRRWATWTGRGPLDRHRLVGVRDRVRADAVGRRTAFSRRQDR